MKFKYEMTIKIAKKTEEELDLHKVEKEKMMRDYNELKAKYDLFKENDGKMIKMNEEYRNQLMTNETMLSQHLNEVKEMQKKVEIVRLGAERAKEEMNAYRLINVKLMEEVN